MRGILWVGWSVRKALFKKLAASSALTLLSKKIMTPEGRESGLWWGIRNVKFLYSLRLEIVLVA
jgi:hypothetical protein